MRARSTQFVSILVLLTALQVMCGAAVSVGNGAETHGGVSTQSYAGSARDAHAARSDFRTSAALRAAAAPERSAVTIVWAVRPPAQHCSALQSFTGFGRAAVRA